MKENRIITISRQYGTGGREIGKKLAERLGIAYYDREILARAAKETGFSEEMFDRLDKRATNSFLYSLTMFGSTGTNGMTLTDQLFIAQSKVLREFANNSSCVIVGRCADHVLREYPNRFDFFIHGSLEARVRRIQSCNDYSLNGKSPEAALEKMDKQRSTYYNYYTGKVWGKCDHYDLCINAGRIGVESSVDVILHYINAVQNT